MSKNSLDNIDAKLSEMLTNSTRVFDISMNALLGDTNLDSVRDDLYDTDKAINELPEIGRAHSELQSHHDLVCRLLLEKKKKLHTYMHKKITNND